LAVFLFFSLSPFRGLRQMALQNRVRFQTGRTCPSPSNCFGKDVGHEAHLYRFVFESAGFACLRAGKEGLPHHAGVFYAVQVTDDFWADASRPTARSAFPMRFRNAKKTGRIANFEVAAGQKKGKFEGLFFNDSDVYKVIEAPPIP
jgi:hypothetical protein